MFKNSLKSIGRSWSSLTGSLMGDRNQKLNPDLPKGDEDILRRQFQNWIEARGGEVSARKHAMEIGGLYQNLTSAGRSRFLRLLAREFGPDRQALRQQCKRYLGTDDTDCGPIEEALRDLLITPRLKLLHQFNTLPQGIKFLVDLRKDLIGFAKTDAELATLDLEIRRLLATWFDVGLLEMRHIDWQSPAALLEKLVAYEAVHEIHSWQDLRHRLHLDRRCYAFFHPNMPGEPLIFVEVALTNGLSDSIQNLLDESTPHVPPEDADTAIFYSISNAQQGLQGISFGNFLIKRVVETLKAELPDIKTFSTLSPIPGFSRWLKGAGAEEVAKLLGEEVMEGLTETDSEPGSPVDLVALLEQSGWHQNGEFCAMVRPLLEKLLYQYFHTTRADGQPIDPVERFHLGNGARIERVNWLGDLSEKGLMQAYGLMVNYLYPIKDIEKNHELYATERKIALSSAVKGLK
ncbi:malonyl-CoA decarboxylase [Geopsychrobacter electrodiphilus]|uniref:malonyl-CoA decarboxylase n=1 Tax=Geopsychrobacter electrodiphilus TaxID=225196 RepID=UPI00036ECDB7|nr:malonyl-CoA decarboxylase [Geopsychrobacter electrodiphilus]